MYKIYFKNLTLKLANGLLLRNTIISLWASAHIPFWPTASWLKCGVTPSIRSSTLGRSFLSSISILLIQLKMEETVSHSSSNGNWFIGSSPVTVWNPVNKPAFKFSKKHYSWCPNCLTIFSLSFFSSSMWAFRHSRMCWDLSSSSSRYLAAIDPTEAVGSGH